MKKIGRIFENIFMDILVVISIILLTIVMIPISMVYMVYEFLSYLLIKIKGGNKNEIILEKK